MCDIPVRYFIRAGGREERTRGFSTRGFSSSSSLKFDSFGNFFKEGGEKKNLFLDNLIR
jgi:hypothetical protein